MLTKSGAKLLDFGLAKSSAAVVSETDETSLATSRSLTAKGTILGTCQYMAPEQLEGREADARTDVFALGSVIFEMVTGTKAFSGTTPANLVSAILKDQPPAIRSLQPLAPPPLDHIVARCLSKDPDERWQDVRDLTRELVWIRSEISSATAAVPVLRPGGRWLTPGVTGVAGLLIGLATAALVSGLWAHRAVEGRPGVTRALIGIAPAERLQALAMDSGTVEGRPSRTTMAWSADGRSIAFTAVAGERQMLYLRPLDQPAASAIGGTEGASSPFFSPDGRWIGFWSSGALRKVSVDGNSPPTVICDASNFYGGTWGGDGTIVFSHAYALWRVPAAGGTPEALAKPDASKGELKYLLPQLLPGDRAVLFTIAHTPMPTWSDTEVVVQTLASGERKVLVHGGADGRYVPGGHLLYLARGTLTAAPFDLQRLQITGGAVAMLGDVMQAANTPNEVTESGAGQFSVSSTGSLLYVPGGVFPDPERSFVWVDRHGATETLPMPPRPYLAPRISRDGRRVTFWTQGDRNVWVLDLSRGVMTHLSSEGRSARAIWTPDGRRITYGSAAGGVENLFWRASDGSGSAERLTTSEFQHSASSWSPDGRTLLFMELNSSTGYDVMALSTDGNRRIHPVLQTRFNEQYAEFSPDGRWIAYVSNESGQNEVYVQPYPGPGARQQVSVDGGTAPAWSRDGKELFYTITQAVGGQAAPTKMMAVAVKLGPTFDAGPPRLLFGGDFGATANIRGYDVAPDGRRFLMVQQKNRPHTKATEMILVQNWIEELAQKVPAR
jgi:eukaryotic-like serine/threonine-protein kinase